jgi:methionyl-tRNA formyltransferase
MTSPGHQEGMKKLRIVFMGTPEFAVASLNALINNSHQVVAIVTAPDKPAGRGRELHASPVKEYALSHGIPVLQPVNLKDDTFIETLHNYNPDLQVVVAFRMLPEKVWRLARIGTINLHASLLPQYRGAAPINWALINGETLTGVTTFFINHEIDTGEILFREKVEIRPDDDAGSLHDRLQDTGARLLVNTVNAIALGQYKGKAQSELAQTDPLKPAPKINKEDCRLRWMLSVKTIENFIRGLSPYPAAWTELSGEGRIIQLKIFRAGAEENPHALTPGSVVSDGRTYLKVASGDGFINILELQLAGKKRMTITEFLRGFQHPEHYSFV